MSQVDVMLEHLVLADLSRSDQERLRGALEAELHRLFKERPPAASREPDVWLPGGSFTLRAGERPEAAAHRIAAALHQQSAPPADAAPPSRSTPPAPSSGPESP